MKLHLKLRVIYLRLNTYRSICILSENKFARQAIKAKSDVVTEKLTTIKPKGVFVQGNGNEKK